MVVEKKILSKNKELSKYSIHIMINDIGTNTEARFRTNKNDAICITGEEEFFELLVLKIV